MKQRVEVILQEHNQHQETVDMSGLAAAPYSARSFDAIIQGKCGKAI